MKDWVALDVHHCSCWIRSFGFFVELLIIFIFWDNLFTHRAWVTTWSFLRIIRHHMSGCIGACSALIITLIIFEFFNFNFHRLSFLIILIMSLNASLFKQSINFERSRHAIYSLFCVQCFTVAVSSMRVRVLHHWQLTVRQTKRCATFWFESSRLSFWHCSHEW